MENASQQALFSRFFLARNHLNKACCSSTKQAENITQNLFKRMSYILKYKYYENK